MPCEINIKRFTFWNDFPKSVVNSIINKTVNTHSITAKFNDGTKQTIELLSIFVSLTMVITNVH